MKNILKSLTLSFSLSACQGEISTYQRPIVGIVEVPPRGPIKRCQEAYSDQNTSIEVCQYHPEGDTFVGMVETGQGTLSLNITHPEGRWANCPTFSYTQADEFIITTAHYAFEGGTAVNHGDVGTWTTNCFYDNGNFLPGLETSMYVWSADSVTLENPVTVPARFTPLSLDEILGNSSLF